MSLSGGIPGLAVHLGLQYGMRDDLAPESKRMWAGTQEVYNPEDCPHTLASSSHRNPVGGGDVYGHAVVEKLVAAVLYLTLVTLLVFHGP
jgi:hypothetical protein